MARRKLICGNWKLHKTVSEAQALVVELKNKLAQVRDADLAIAPPYTALYPVAQRLEGSNIKLAAQELYWEDKGAFTGAVSGALLKDVGCTYVLIGHSERRQFFGETLETSNKRVLAALRAGLVPILCVGESLAEREAGRTFEVVGAQLDGALQGRSAAELASLVVAYEPVWAIGTGKVATPAQAQEAHAFVRERLRSKDAGLAESTRILYGGSVKPENASEILQQKDVDGALVGGASLDAVSFAGIAKAD